MIKKVWIFGLVAAVASAAAATVQSPAWLHQILEVVAVVAGVLAGYHWPGGGKKGESQVPIKNNNGSSGTIVALLLLVTLAMLGVGCRFAGFSLGLSSPAWGSVSLAVDGGAIGSPAQSAGFTRPAVATNLAIVVVGPAAQ